jgi:dolichyl-phosphate-mannose-protein mannosyltransferase
MRPQSRWVSADWFALGTVLVIATAVRLPRLGTPAGTVFDEVYYATDACLYLHPGDADLCGAERPLSSEHPPLGKWVIALGIRLLGFDPAGWRAASLVLGVATVAVVYVLARRLAASTMAAVTASGLLAVDLLHITSSRTATLDVLVTAMATTAVLTASMAGPSSRTWTWPLLTGVLLGAAVATKWSGVLVVPLLVWLLVSDETGRRRKRPFLPELIRLAVCLVAVPAAVYISSYAGRLSGDLLAAPWARSSWVWMFLARQRSMLGTHIDLTTAGNNYVSPPWSWVLLKRPVAYAFDGADGRYREVLALGSPVAWWLGLAALGVSTVLWRRSRDPLVRRAHAVAVVGFASAYLPWFVVYLSRDYVFNYYLLPALPFMYLSAGLCASALLVNWPGRAAVATTAAAVLVASAWLYPLAVGLPLTYEQWASRMLFDACAPQFDSLEAAQERPTPQPLAQAPPRGWCWI